MKIRHKVPYREPQSAVLTPEYQAEVDLTMARAEAALRKAQKRFDRAEVRLSVARRTKARTRVIAELEALVELRRVELAKVHRLMVATGFPSTSRGTKSHRHIATGEPL